MDLFYITLIFSDENGNLKNYFKVQLFWGSHKNVLNRPYGFEIYLVNVKTISTIAQIFVAFSEKLNFKLQKELFLVHMYLTTVSRFPERKFDAFFIANGETLGFFASCAQFVRWVLFIWFALIIVYTYIRVYTFYAYMISMYVLSIYVCTEIVLIRWQRIHVLYKPNLDNMYVIFGQQK